MAEHWQLYEAKNKFSELIEKALNQGPQVITRRGEEVAVVLSRIHYEHLIRNRQGLVEFFRSSPLKGVELDLERDKTLSRDVQL